MRSRHSVSVPILCPHPLSPSSLTEEEECPGVVTVSVREADFAMFDERAEAAKAGIPFHGRHDGGDEYGTYCFASWNGKMRESPHLQRGVSLFRPADFTSFSRRLDDFFTADVR